MASLNHIMPTLLPGLGPRFLGTLMGSSPLPGWMLCGPNTELFWLQGPVTLVFLRPGLRPLWPGGLPTVGLGCIAGLSTLPSVNAPRLLGNSTALAKMDRHTRKGELSCGITVMCKNVMFGQTIFSLIAFVRLEKNSSAMWVYNLTKDYNMWLLPCNNNIQQNESCMYLTAHISKSPLCCLQCPHLTIVNQEERMHYILSLHLAHQVLPLLSYALNLFLTFCNLHHTSDC